MDSLEWPASPAVGDIVDMVGVRGSLGVITGSDDIN